MEDYRYRDYGGMPKKRRYRQFALSKSMGQESPGDVKKEQKQKVMMTKYTEFVRKFFPRRTKRTGRLISGTLKGALKVIRIATGNIGGSWLHAFPILKSGS